jgi:nucleoid DNA-binding protein
MAKKKAASKEKPMSKSELLNVLAEKTELSRKEVGNVLDQLTEIIRAELTNKKGARVFNVPGLLKIYVHHKSAMPSREVTNPRTGEKMMSKPKPAMDVVKVRPLKALKEMV